MNTLDIHRGQRLGFRCFQAGVLFLQLGQDARQLQTAIADGRIHFIHRVTVVAGIMQQYLFFKVREDADKRAVLR